MSVQDYKINYKSDFVLTINGDAGWATQFCIKFWTGMPSQAYFVGFDGVKYVNCRVGDTPTQLLVMFDDHHLPIGPLRMQIAYHTTIEEFPGSVFDEVTNARDVIVTIDGTDYQVMLDFTGEDAPELEFDLPAYANEAERIQNELQRQQNEADRIAAELQREQATAAAVQGAENVNAQLNGTTLTVTNRQGVSTSVNTKGERGEQGPEGPQGETGETGPRGTSIVSFTPKSTTATTIIYTVTFSDGTTQDVAIPKGAKGDTGATGPQGPQGDTGVSITAFTYASETETDMIYTVTFSDSTTQQVAIPKGEKGDTGEQGPVGPQGPQGPMGDVAVITPEQQAAFTMYSVPGRNTDGPMTQKAVTYNFAEIGDGSQESDLDIEDQFGNKLARFMNGHIKTKYFDSDTDVPISSGDTQTGDLEFADTENNVLMRLYGGHVKTKEFDSSSIEKKNISQSLWKLIGSVNLVNVFKKVCCIGDSFTAGFTKIGSVDIGSAAARPLGNNWPSYMENLTGGNQYDNIAIGNSTTHHWRYEDGPQPDYKPDLDLADDTTYEAYIIALGVNDERTNVTVGTTSDIASNKSSNADTFCGNYDFIVRQLMEWNSKAHIFCITIPLSEGNNVVPYNDIISEIGNLYSNKVHVISLEGEDVDLSWIAANFANGHYCPIVYNYFATIIYRRISDTIWSNNIIFRETPYN